MQIIVFNIYLKMKTWQLNKSVLDRSYLSTMTMEITAENKKSNCHLNGRSSNVTQAEDDEHDTSFKNSVKMSLQNQHRDSGTSQSISPDLDPTLIYNFKTQRPAVPATSLISNRFQLMPRKIKQPLHLSKSSSTSSSLSAHYNNQGANYGNLPIPKKDRK